MTKRAAVSMDRFTVEDAWEYYESSRDSIVQMHRRTRDSIVDSSSIPDPRFFGMNITEVDEYFTEKLNEADRQACLFLIASAEGTFHFDFFDRIYARKKDEVSLIFRSMYREKRDHNKTRVNLDEDILETWADRVPKSKSHISDFRGALNYRHWLAHGRWWVPKMGRKYDPAGVFQIIDSLFRTIDLAD